MSTADGRATSNRVVIQEPVILTAIGRSEEEAQQMIEWFIQANGWHQDAGLYVSKGTVDLSGA